MKRDIVPIVDNCLSEKITHIYGASIANIDRYTANIDCGSRIYLYKGYRDAEVQRKKKSHQLEQYHKRPPFTMGIS